MGSHYKKSKSKTQLLSSKVAKGIMVAVAVAAVAKFTPLLSMLGITNRATAIGEMGLALKKKNFEADAMRERLEAEAKAQAEREATRRAMEEADMRRSHEEDLARKTAEEAAFNAWYKPALECQNKTGKWELSVKCGNDFIAAKKYFMEHHPKQ